MESQRQNPEFGLILKTHIHAYCVSSANVNQNNWRRRHRRQLLYETK